VANVAVTAVQYSAARPMAGIPFSIRPLLASQGDTAQNTLVRLYIYDDKGEAKKVGERPLEKRRQGGWSAPRFYHTFTTGGWHSGYVEVQDENLPQDNRRYFALQVLDAVRVLAINGVQSEVRDIDRDPILFPRAALLAANSLLGQQGAKGQKAIEVKVDYPDLLSRIGARELRKYPLVLLGNVGRLSSDAVHKLEDYVDGGGSLMVFLGDNIDKKFYNETLAAETRRHGGLLPARLVELQGNLGAAGKKRDTSYAAVASLAYAHPALAPFEDAKNGNLAGITFKALWKLKPQADQAAVLMHARELAAKSKTKRAQAGHLPLLCEKNFGKGRVLLCASTCNRGWTNFPMSSSFLPWMHQLTCYLAQQPMKYQGFFATGDAVPIPVSVTEGVPPVMVKKPDGSKGYATMGDDAERPLEFTDTAQAGIYTLYPGDKKREQLFAVNLDPYESNLTYLDDVLVRQYGGNSSDAANVKIEAGFKDLLPSRPLVTYVADPGRVRDVSLAARRGIKLWDILLWGALILVLFEPWLANRISMRHYGKPKEVTPEAVPQTGRWGRVPTPEISAEQEVAR